jgi:poly(A) polymerase
MLKTLANKVLHQLSEAGFESYLVGGCVRDLLLGNEPKDFDIVTSATPTQVAEVFPGASLVGAHFGVSIIQMEGHTFELATMRRDGVYVDSRRPEEVTFTTDVYEDMQRRDLTVNAMVMDLNGNVHDLGNGGLEDLKNKVLRAVGVPADRFEQDALRLLRAVRFACKLGFTIEPNTLKGMQENAHRIVFVSAERVAQELVDILTSGRADVGMELLLQTRLLGFVLPEVQAMVGVEQNDLHHPEGDVWVHTKLLLAQLEKGCSVTLALAALLHDVAKPVTKGEKNGQPTFYGHEEVGAKMTRDILNRLRFSTDVVDTVVSHVAQHMDFRLVQEMRKAKVMRFLAQPNFAELLALHKLDATAGRVNLVHAEFVEKLLAETPEEKLHPVLLVTGRDLIEMGMKPGPLFKTLLFEVGNAQLAGEVTTKEEALAFVVDTLETMKECQVEGGL